MSCHQAIVWIDENEARILRMDAELRHVSTIYAQPLEPGRLCADASASLGEFFHRTARALDSADEIVIVGPSDTKSRFAEYLHRDEHALDPRVLGVEAIALPGDELLVGYAKLYFAEGGPRRRAAK